LEKLLTSILKHKGFPSTATFQDVYSSSSIQLRCFATEVQTASTKEFSLKKSPTTSVLLAVRASMSIPFFYTPVQDPTTHLYLFDGGIIHSSPFVYLNPEEIQDSIGVVFQTATHPILNSIQDVFNAVLDTMIYRRVHDLKEKFHRKVIFIPEGDVSWLNFQATREERLTMIQLAKDATELFLTTTSKYHSRRRYSVC
jgi:predicted acylesterase/phospholipase RssA